jgi:hypothetical protein
MTRNATPGNERNAALLAFEILTDTDRPERASVCENNRGRGAMSSDEKMNNSAMTSASANEPWRRPDRALLKAKPAESEADDESNREASAKTKSERQ